MNFSSKLKLGAQIALALLVLSVSLNSSRAENLDSPSYHIKGFTVGEGANEDQASSNYGLLENFSGNLNDNRFVSTSYKIGAGEGFVLMANVPLVSCFETTTAGATNCSDSKVNPGGMVKICGQGGCYNRARFELDTQYNATDTLYSLQITTDPAWATYDYIDGATFLIESGATHDLNDYQTETAWEGTVSGFNIYGLTPGTTYYLRATALHGDFSESGPSPAVNATAAQPQITFDIDIDGTGGGASETAGPYTVDLGTLQLGQVTTAGDLIWLDLGSNLNGGAKIFIRDQYAGLYSSGTSYTLPAATGDLDSITGYGIKQYSAAQTYLGPLSATAKYNQSGNNVGSITDASYGEVLYNTSGTPIYQGRAGIQLKGRPAEDTPNSSDFTDSITFTVTGDY